MTNQLDKDYADGDRAFFARNKDLEETSKRLPGDLAAIDESIANGENPDSNAEERLQSLVNGTTLPASRSWEERRLEILYARRDVEQARDYLADKKRKPSKAARSFDC